MNGLDSLSCNWQRDSRVFETPLSVESVNRENQRSQGDAGGYWWPWVTGKESLEARVATRGRCLTLNGCYINARKTAGWGSSGGSQVPGVKWFGWWSRCGVCISLRLSDKTGRKAWGLCYLQPVTEQSRGLRTWGKIPFTCSHLQLPNCQRRSRNAGWGWKLIIRDLEMGYGWDVSIYFPACLQAGGQLACSLCSLPGSRLLLPRYYWLDRNSLNLTGTGWQASYWSFIIDQNF